MTDTLNEDVITGPEPSEEYRSIWTDLRGVSFEQGWLEVKGVKVRYLRSGKPDAPKIVMLAGTGGHTETFAATVGPLGAEFDCWAIDIPGSGYSDMPDTPWDAIHTATFVRDMADVIGGDRITVLGVSVGAWHALMFGHLFPERTSHLILVSPGGGPMPEESDSWFKFWMARDMVVGSTDANARKEITENPTWELAEEVISGLIRDPRRRNDDIIAARLDVNRQPGAQEAFEKVIWFMKYEPRMENTLTRDDLRAMTMPVLGFYEDKDQTIPMIRGMFECLPNSRLVRVEGVSHWPHYEAPDQINAMALDFLKDR